MAANGDDVAFIYRRRYGEDDIPYEATHVSTDQSVEVIPSFLFFQHSEIIEFISHAGVKRIGESAFHESPTLERVIIPGVEDVWDYAFYDCEALTYVECDNLERIGRSAFNECESLSNINLPSATVIDSWAFTDCTALTDATFGKNLESMSEGVFFGCPNLERITIPLKNGLFPHDNIFQGCGKLRHVDLVEGAILQETANALVMEAWRDDMNAEIGSINQILTNARAGAKEFRRHENDAGEKAKAIREWIRRVMRKIIRYKAQHRRHLSEIASALQLAVPSDIVTNSVLPFVFLELPDHVFEGEEN